MRKRPLTLVVGKTAIVKLNIEHHHIYIIISLKVDHADLLMGFSLTDFLLIFEKTMMIVKPTTKAVNDCDGYICFI